MDRSHSGLRPFASNAQSLSQLSAAARLCKQRARPLEMVGNFKVLRCQQEARRLNRMVYAVSRKKQFAAGWELLRQTRRSALSVGLNVAERHDRGGHREIGHFLTIAKGSCAELETALLIAQDLNYLSGKELNELLLRVDRGAALIGGLLRHLRKTANRGPKYPKCIQRPLL